MKFIKATNPEKSLSKVSKDNLARLVLDNKDKFDSMLKTVKDGIFELKTKFSAREAELHITKYIKTL